MITENYIKMCEGAEEIQKAWIPLIGDWVIFPNIPLPTIIRFKKTINEMNKYDFIYLPTQEQLQEMMTMDTSYAKKYNKKEGAIFCGFYIFLDMMDWVKNYLKKPTIINCNSMNEIWLAFVMYEKYNKTWTGKNWVKK